MKNSVCSACWQGWKHIMVWGVWQIRKIWAGDSEEPHHHFRPRHRRGSSPLYSCTVLYSAVLYTVRCYNLCPSVRGCPPIAQHQSGSQYFQRQQNIFAAAVWRLCEVSACTCLATWAGWGSTRPPRPPTGPPASVCLSMLLLTLFSISTGRATAFCRGFLVVL